MKISRVFGFSLQSCMVVLCGLTLAPVFAVCKTAQAEVPPPVAIQAAPAEEPGADTASAGIYAVSGRLEEQPEGAALAEPQVAEAEPAPRERPAPGEMVSIKGGTFLMGSPPSEAGRYPNEGPQHEVTVSSFYLGKTEVTVGEFRAFTEATGYKTNAETAHFRGGYVWVDSEWGAKDDANWKNPYFNQSDDHPVTLVSWFDAVNYCNWKSRKEGFTPAYTIKDGKVTWNKKADGYRLPTEAEWEYACRAGTVTPYSTGESISTDQANYDGTTLSEDGSTEGVFRGTPLPAGSFPPNPWGLYDMHGNLWEWCWDWYGTYSGGAQTDPEGASSGTTRVLRGGSWSSPAGILRSVVRSSDAPALLFGSEPSGRAASFRGFRVARSAG